MSTTRQPALTITATTLPNAKPETTSWIARGIEFINHVTHLAIALVRRTAASLSVIAINFLLPIRLIGALNKRLPIIHSLFLAYPASDRFAKHYYFEFVLRRLKWRPAIYGVFVQGGKLGVLMCTSTTEADFTNPKNSALLDRLQNRVTAIQSTLGVKSVSYSGVLPHYVTHGHGKGPSQKTNQTIARLVDDARLEVMLREEQTHTPVIVLGSMGAIGSELVARLKNHGVETYGVDNRQDQDMWPYHLQDHPCTLIDVARKGAIEEYLGKCWNKMTLLNETYPEPHGEDLEKLKSLGMPVYHIVGVTGKALPDFPAGYAGGVPCCAMHEEDHAQVKLTKLA